MSYTALYRKYRPKDFKSVVGQDVIVNVLKNSIKSQHISHAYLFSGPRGTGKTSVAKIFAKAVNCLNFDKDICFECENCKALQLNDSDIIEIDAASNNGVEEIRNIRENVKLLPSFCKYKIYIIDEVHMLSTGAFNALLKTLEEPPSHVIFILATTEINKIPLTVLSRCQRFDFSKITDEDILSRLKFILKSENCVIEEKIIKYISQISDGGLRDAINLLDQVLSLDKEKITIDDIDDISGKISNSLIYQLFEYFIDSNYIDTLKLINTFFEKGKDFNDLVNKMLIFTRDITINLQVEKYFDDDYTNILNKYNFNNNQIMFLTKSLNELSYELKNSIDSKMLVEIYMLQIINFFKTEKLVININSKEINNIENIHELNSQNNNKSEDISLLKTAKEVSKNDFNELKLIRVNNVLSEASKEVLKKLNEEYDSFNDFISNKKFNLASVVLLEGKIVAASNRYILFAFNDKSNIDIFYENLSLIELLVYEVYKSNYKVVAVLNDEWQNIKKEYVIKKKNGENYVFIEENDVKLEKKENNNDAQDFAMNIFGEDTVSVK